MAQYIVHTEFSAYGKRRGHNSPELVTVNRGCKIEGDNGMYNIYRFIQDRDTREIKKSLLAIVNQIWLQMNCITKQ